MKKRILISVCMAISFIFLSSIAKCEIEKPITPEETEIIDRIQYYNEHPEELKAHVQPTIDAKLMATIVDAVAPESDDNCKIAVMDCILNRVRTRGFPNSIEEVCTQKNQWTGYTSESSFSESTYKLVTEYLKNLNELRISSIDRNMTYMRVATKGLYFRTGLEAENEKFVSYYSA